MTTDNPESRESWLANKTIRTNVCSNAAQSAFIADAAQSAQWRIERSAMRLQNR
jgi:hypothetical protein